MKKLIFTLFMLTLVFILLVSPVFADDATPSDGLITSYLSWDFLGTMGGATAAVLLIVQFLKAPLDKIWKIPTRFVVFIISFLILIAVELSKGGVFQLDKLVLIFLNALIVSVAAMGSYEVTFNKIKGKTVT